MDASCQPDLSAESCRKNASRRRNENVWARHELMGKATREAIKAMGLELFSKRPGNVLTSVKVPEGVDGGKIVSIMRDEYGVTIAGGQGSMKKYLQDSPPQVYVGLRCHYCPDISRESPQKARIQGGVRNRSKSCYGDFREGGA